MQSNDQSSVGVWECIHCWYYLVLEAGDTEVEEIQQAVELGHRQVCEPLL